MLTVAVSLVLAVLAAVLSPGAEAAGTGAWRCDATAVRGTVLGQPLPAVATGSSSAACTDSRAGLPDASLPLPISLSAVSAATKAVGTGPARDQQVLAAGGVADLRVRALPALPIRLPVDEVLAQVPDVSVTLPVVGTKVGVDLEPAVRAVLGDGSLPDLDLVRVAGATAYATGACVSGSPQVFGTPQVAGVQVLGVDAPIDVGGTVTNTLNLMRTSKIDFETLDLTPLGLSPTITALLKPVLAGLPDLAVPAALAEVSVTAGGQTRDAAGRLTQRALRVQASVAGQPLADLVVGEASTASAAVDCAPDAPDATELVLGCTTRRLTLIDVVPSGSRVRLLGAADKALAGRTVEVAFQATGQVVARPTVQPDGSFTATAPLPARALRSTNRARYVARVGDERSLNLKLERRMLVTGIEPQGETVVIRGRLTQPVAPRAADRTVVVTRRLDCTTYEEVGRGRANADGTFRIAVPAPTDAAAAVYRLKGRVRKSTTNPKLFPTYTLPRAVDLL